MATVKPDQYGIKRTSQSPWFGDLTDPRRDCPECGAHTLVNGFGITSGHGCPAVGCDDEGGPPDQRAPLVATPRTRTTTPSPECGRDTAYPPHRLRSS